MTQGEVVGDCLEKSKYFVVKASLVSNVVFILYKTRNEAPSLICLQLRVELSSDSEMESGREV
jgi:hypothetical protein